MILSRIDAGHHGYFYNSLEIVLLKKKNGVYFLK